MKGKWPPVPFHFYTLDFVDIVSEDLLWEGQERLQKWKTQSEIMTRVEKGGAVKNNSPQRWATDKFLAA